MANRITRLARDLKPYILAWEELNNVGQITIGQVDTGGTGGGMEAPDLDGAFHTGALSWNKVDKAGSTLDQIGGTLPWGRVDKSGSQLTDLDDITAQAKLFVRVRYRIRLDNTDLQNMILHAYLPSRETKALLLGSSQSRNPSPRKLNAITVREIARPGKMVIQGDV